jgi:ribose 5-phosphate isomerase B
MPPSDVEVRELVRRTLNRLLETAPKLPANPPGSPEARPAPATAPSRLIDEAVIKTLAAGATLPVPRGTLVTPLARQAALDRRIILQDEGAPAPRVSQAPAQQRIAIGADHGGYSLKEALKPHLQTLGYEVVDCGAHNTDPVDYPDIAYAVARLVADGKCAVGIIVDGAGIGSCMAANKVPGVRAALCYDHATAVNSREHNHANVLTLGAGLIGTNLAKQIVTDWLATPFGPGRHAKRVEKIMAIEKRFSKG